MPGYKSIGEPKELEEERRLFYVGITRAKEYLHLTCAKRRTIFGSTSYNSISRFIKEIPATLLEGYENMEEKQEETFKDSNYSWTYGKTTFGTSQGSKIKTYKLEETPKTVAAKSPVNFAFKTPESFLNGLNKNKEVDITKYQEGQRIYHKKFGEGTINKIEAEGDDAKIDINFDKVGHKGLMAKFAGLEIL